MLLFVYGTLMKGLHNHFLLKTSECLGSYKTVKKHMIYIDGTIPYLSDTFQKYNIQGEVYNVSSETLKELDELEGEGEWYIRKKIMVSDTNGDQIEVEAYYNYGKGIEFMSDNYHSFIMNYNDYTIL